MENRVEALEARVARAGVDSLDDAELFAWLFSQGPSLRELRRARRVLESAGGLRALLREEAAALKSRAGLGRRRAERLLVALALARRAVSPGEPRPRLQSPEQIYAYLAPSFAHLRREVFHVLCFNVRNILLRDVRVAEGTSDQCPVDPREVFGAAVSVRASALVLVHNHPSGDPKPSTLDVALTHRLREGGALLGIHVLDHVIIGDGRYVSLLQKNLLGVPATQGRRPWPRTGER